MKTETKIIATILSFIFIFGIGAFIGVKLQPQPETPQYSITDSLSKDSALNRIKIADSLALVYKSEADRLKSDKDKLSKSNYKLSEKLNELLKSPGAKCEEKLNVSLLLNDSLKIELNKCDSAYEAVDKEAEQYSNQIEDYKKLNSIEIKRFKRLSFEMDSITVLYEDSLTSVNKRLYSKFFKRNGLWNKNEFRNYVMKPIEK